MVNWFYPNFCAQWKTGWCTIYMFSFQKVCARPVMLCSSYTFWRCLSPADLFTVEPVLSCPLLPSQLFTAKSPLFCQALHCSPYTALDCSALFSYTALDYSIQPHPLFSIHWTLLYSIHCTPLYSIHCTPLCFIHFSISLSTHCTALVFLVLQEVQSCSRLCWRKSSMAFKLCDLNMLAELYCFMVELGTINITFLDNYLEITWLVQKVKRFSKWGNLASNRKQGLLTDPV